MKYKIHPASGTALFKALPGQWAFVVCWKRIQKDFDE
jgi:hypothetical protein